MASRFVVLFFTDFVWARTLSKCQGSLTALPNAAPHTHSLVPEGGTAYCCTGQGGPTR